MTNNNINKFHANDTVLFTCTCQDDTQLVAHSKQICVITSLCDENNYDRKDVGYMYNIRFNDGFEHQAFEDELS